ncbi:LacI family DNA-binding transcriptional regulator [Luedemannella helvata]|uniref:LacI family DNA-binding transcriptional regulator n=1 Tax=Luedemannella helvata TaxID=349315 RepID=A0ABP4VZ51_9ACTN
MSPTLRRDAGGRRDSVMMDVARLAGVSHQTVSRVLNNQANVRPETRERVLEAMRQLDYRRNSAARTLVTRRSRTLGLISFESTLFGPASMVYQVEQAAREAGYFLTIASVRSLDRRAVLDAVDRLREQSVEGIVATAHMPAAGEALAELPAGLPIVVVGLGAAAATRPGGGIVPSVATDNHTGALLATRHLVALGHKEIRHLSGPVDWPEAQDRVAGWRDVLTDAGLPVGPVLAGDWSARSGYELGRLLARDPDMTAAFCANDQMALGFARALHETGRRVPHDVSVVGFDDVPEAEFYLPPLTTVRQDFVGLGRRSLDVLLAQVEARDSGAAPAGAVTPTLITPELVVRASTVAPPD